MGGAVPHWAACSVGMHFSTLLVIASVVVFICISTWFCVFIYQDAQEQYDPFI